MGLIPLDPPWPKDHEPTEKEWITYAAYLERLMSRSRLGRRWLRKHKPAEPRP